MRLRSLSIRCFAATALVVMAATDACAGSSSGGSRGAGDLKSSSGGTGLSKSGGNGGTGVPTTAIQPLNNLQSTFKPSHVIAPPPAGTRPHTDLAAAEKRNNLSSQGLIKHSTLYNKIAANPHDPILAPPVLNKIGGTVESARSFHSVPGFTAEESKGNVYPTHGGRIGDGRPMGNLSSAGNAAMDGELDNDAAAERAAQRTFSAWFDTLLLLLATLATGGLGWWLWQQTPKGLRPTLPALANSTALAVR